MFTYTLKHFNDDIVSLSIFWHQLKTNFICLTIYMLCVTERILGAAAPPTGLLVALQALQVYD